MRINHKDLGFDAFDKLYRSYIDKRNWPFSSRIFIPVAFSNLVRKDTRLLANKIAGKLIPTKDGQELGAVVGTELLHSQWQDVDTVEDEGMLMRWFRVSQNARRLGAGWAYVPWKKSRQFDGPTFVPMDNRDVLTIPGSTSVDEGVFLRFHPTLNELFIQNDRSATGPVYNPEVLKRLETMTSSDDGNNNQQISVNRQLKGLNTVTMDSNSGTQGRTRRITIIKYLTPKRWLTFVPSQGGDDGEQPFLVLQDIPNPYKHQEVPVVRLVYYPIDDDIYGVSELEPIRSMLKGLNALVCNYTDSVNVELFPILKGHPTNVDYKTVDYHARAIWLMNNPATDLVKLEHSNTNLQKFMEVYKMLAGAMAEALGESSGDASSLDAFSADKTATEVQDLATLRTARDNFNKLALSAAMAKMVHFWFEMDKQFLDDNQVIRVAGKEAIEYFINEGLHLFELSEDGYEFIADFMQGNPQYDFVGAYEALRQQGALEKYAKPLFPTGPNGNPLPKLTLDRNGKSGFLTVTKSDLSGNYRYIPDIESISLANSGQEAQNMSTIFNMAHSVEQELVASGDAPRWKDMIVKMASKLKIQDADQYFGGGEGMSATPGQAPTQGQSQPVSSPHPPREVINYKDLPPDLQAQMAQQANLTPQAGQGQSPQPLTAASIPTAPQGA